MKSGTDALNTVRRDIWQQLLHLPEPDIARKLKAPEPDNCQHQVSGDGRVPALPLPLTVGPRTILSAGFLGAV